MTTTLRRDQETGHAHHPLLVERERPVSVIAYERFTTERENANEMPDCWIPTRLIFTLAAACWSVN